MASKNRNKWFKPNTNWHGTGTWCRSCGGHSADCHCHEEEVQLVAGSNKHGS